jgi:hypothetical protein
MLLSQTQPARLYGDHEREDGDLVDQRLHLVLGLWHLGRLEEQQQELEGAVEAKVVDVEVEQHREHHGKVHHELQQTLTKCLAYDKLNFSPLTGQKIHMYSSTDANLQTWKAGKYAISVPRSLSLSLSLVIQRLSVWAARLRCARTAKQITQAAHKGRDTI